VAIDPALHPSIGRELNYTNVLKVPTLRERQRQGSGDGLSDAHDAKQALSSPIRMWLACPSRKVCQKLVPHEVLCEFAAS
jgi:hypothetical protein